ncbi:hypothetical protein DPEC_G00351240 [Dallia pectoralis]|uniref:Uncharacterized protein n=1 Tax=Dallia pectoralis TaxID=75939 RepID=A0ACC2F1S5_DALPE|nr:hypothetical protein DPEC_G00351240 [Dallia pectoralis]
MEVDIVSHSLHLLETLKESYENNKLADVKDAVEDLLIGRINLAVAGNREPEKAAFLNTLRGLGPEDEGATPSPCPTPLDELAVYPNPKHPDFQLWDLPPPHTASFNLEGRPARRRGTRCIFALLASETDTEKVLEERRKASLEVLKAHGVALPKVFLVRPNFLEQLDFPGLLEEMERDLLEIRAHALLLALPTLYPALVTRKREAFKALSWAAAALSGGVSAIPVPLVASMVGVRILTKARASLSLDDESVERLAEQRSMEAVQLKALRKCSLSVEVTKGEVKLRLAAAEKELTTNTTLLMDMAMPRPAGRSFSVMLQALNRAIDEMAALISHLIFNRLSGVGSRG